jgi:competence protein ComGF
MDVDLFAVIFPPFWIYYFNDNSFRNIYYKWKRVRDDDYEWIINFHHLQGGTLDTSLSWIPRTTIQPYEWDKDGNWKKAGVASGKWSVFQAFDTSGYIDKYNNTDTLIKFNDYKDVKSKEVILSENLKPGLYKQNFYPGLLAGEEIEITSGKQKGLRYVISDNDYNKEEGFGYIEVSSEAVIPSSSEGQFAEYVKVYIYGGLKEDGTIDSSIAVSQGDTYSLRCKYGWVKVGDLRQGKYFPAGTVTGALSEGQEAVELELRVSDSSDIVYFPQIPDLFKDLFLVIGNNKYRIISSQSKTEDPYSRDLIMIVEKGNYKINAGDKFEIYGDTYSLDSRAGIWFTYETSTSGYGLPTRAPVIGDLLLSPVSVYIPPNSKIDIDNIWNPENVFVSPQSPAGCRFSIRTERGGGDRIALDAAKSCYVNFGLYMDSEGVNLFRTYTDGKKEWMKKWVLIKGSYSNPSLMQGKDGRWYLSLKNEKGELIQYVLETDFEEERGWKAVKGQQTFDLKGSSTGEETAKSLETGVDYYDIAQDATDGEAFYLVKKSNNGMFYNTRLGAADDMHLLGIKSTSEDGYQQIIRKRSENRFRLVLSESKLKEYESENFFDEVDKDKEMSDYSEIEEVIRKNGLSNLQGIYEMPEDVHSTHICAFYAEGKKGNGIYTYNFSMNILSFVCCSSPHRPALTRNEFSNRLYLSCYDDTGKIKMYVSYDEGINWTEIRGNGV